MSIFNRIRLWFFLARKFRQIAQEIAGLEYYNNRHAIKHHIRRRVRAVLAGFDESLQLALFRGDLHHLSRKK